MHPEQKAILRVFAAEASERLDELDELLGEIEADPEHRQTIDQFMRAAHTLKGSAGVAGVEDVAELTHAVESVVEQLRERKVQPTPDLFDRLARALDVITRALPDIKSGETAGKILDDVRDDLHRWLEEVGGRRKSVSSQREIQGGFILGEYDQVRIGVLLEQGKTLCVLRFSVPEETENPAGWGAMALKSLRALGVCVATSPPSADLAELEPGQGFSVLFGTDESEPEIVQRLTESLGAAPSIRPYHAEPTQENGTSGELSATVVADRTVRVDLEVLDDLLRLVGELMINRDRYRQVAKQMRDELGDTSLAAEIDDSSGQLGHLTGELQDAIMQARMVPVARIYRRIKRSARQASRERGISVKLKTEGAEIELDKNLVDSLAVPLAEFMAQFVRETESDYSVDVRAVRRWNHVLLTIDSPVAATEAQRTALEAAVTQTGGTVELQESSAGNYLYTVALPLTLAIIRVMMTSVGHEVYAFPIESVKETLEIHSGDIVRVKGTRATALRGTALSLVFLDELFDVKRTMKRREEVGTSRVLVLSGGGQEIRSNPTIGVVVDRLIGIREVVIKPLSQRFSAIREISGSAILGDDQIALILNAEVLVHQAISSFAFPDKAARKPRRQQGQRRTA